MAGGTYTVTIEANTEPAKGKIRELESMIERLDNKEITITANTRGIKDISRQVKAATKKAPVVIGTKFDASKGLPDLVKRMREESAKMYKDTEKQRQKVSRQAKRTTDDALRETKKRFNLESKLSSKQEAHAHRQSRKTGRDVKGDLQRQQELYDSIKALNKYIKSNPLDLASASSEQIEARKRDLSDLRSFMKEYRGLAKETRWDMDWGRNKASFKFAGMLPNIDKELKTLESHGTQVRNTFDGVADSIAGAGKVAKRTKIPRLKNRNLGSTSIDNVPNDSAFNIKNKKDATSVLSAHRGTSKELSELELRKRTIGLTEDQIDLEGRLLQTRRAQEEALLKYSATQGDVTEQARIQRRLTEDTEKFQKRVNKGIDEHNRKLIRNAGALDADDAATRLRNQIDFYEQRAIDKKISSKGYEERIGVARKEYDKYVKAESDLMASVTENERISATARMANASSEIDRQLRSIRNNFGSYSEHTDNLGYAGIDLEESSSQVQSAMSNAAKSLGKGIVVTEEYNAKTKKLEATVKNSYGNMEKYAISYNRATGGLSSQFMGGVQTIKPVSEYVGKLGKKFGELGRYAVASVGVYEVFGAISDGVNRIRELDTAMTELKKTSDSTTKQYSDFTAQANMDAKEIGSTTTQLVSSAADWSRLGYSLADSQILSKNTGILKNVSEFESIDAATESMVGILQAYNIQAKDSGEIIDKLNLIGNNYSVSTSDLASGLQVAGSALQVGGNSVEESMALITAMNSSIQDVNQAARAARTVSMRLHGATAEELIAEGEDADGVIETTAKMEEQIRSLTAVNGKAGVSLTDASGRIRSDFQVLSEIAERWDEIEQADIEEGTNRASVLLEAMAGKNRANALASLLNSPELLSGVYKDATQNYAGSAEKELNTYMGSIDAHIMGIQESWNQLWQSSSAKGLINPVIDFGAGILDVANNVGLLNTLFGVTGGLIGGLKNVGLFKRDSDTGKISNIFTQDKKARQQELDYYNKELERVGIEKAALDTRQSTLDTDSEALKNLAQRTQEINASANATERASKITEAENEIMKDASDSAKEHAKAISANTSIVSAYTNAQQKEINDQRKLLNEQEEEFKRGQENAKKKSWSTGLKDLGKDLGLRALNMGLDMLLAGGVGAAIQGVAMLADYAINYSDKIIEKGKEAKTIVDETNKSYQSNADLVKNSADRYSELAAGVEKSGTAIRNKSLNNEEFEEFIALSNEMATAFPTLVKGYDESGNAILNLGSNTADTTYKLNSALETQRALANYEIAKQLPAQFKGTREEARQIDKDIARYDKEIEYAKNALNYIDGKGQESYEELLDSGYFSAKGDGAKEWLEGVRDAIFEANGVMGELKFNPDTEEWSLSNFDQDLIPEDRRNSLLDRIGDIGSEAGIEFSTQMNQSMQQKAYAQALKNAKWAELLPSVQALMETSSAWNDLSESTQNGLTQMLANRGFDGIDNIEDFIQNEMIAPLTAAKENSKLRKAYDDLFALESKRAEMSVGEWAKQRDDLLNTISEGTGKEVSELAEAFGYVTENADGKKIGVVKDKIDQMAERIGDSSDKFRKFANSLTGEEFEIAYDIVINDEKGAIDSIKDLRNEIDRTMAERSPEAKDYSLDAMESTYNKVLTNSAAVQTAIQQSDSATGLATESIYALENAYRNLDTFDSERLFMRTAQGIKVNRDELAHLNTQQERMIKNDFEKAIDLQTQALAKAQKEYEKLNSAPSSERIEGELQAAEYNLEDAKAELKSLLDLRSQYYGATSALNKWLAASQGSEEGDNYGAVSGLFKQAEQLQKEGNIGTDEFKSAVDYLWSEDASTLSPQELSKTFDVLKGKAQDWYQVNSDGSLNAAASVEALKSDCSELAQILGSDDVNTAFKTLEDGTKQATLDANEFKDAWGFSDEVVLDIAGMLRDQGWEVTLENVAQGFEEAEKSAQKVSNILGEDYDWDFVSPTVEKAEEQIGKLEQAVQKYKGKDGEYDYTQPGAKETSEAYTAGLEAREQANNPAIMNVLPNQVIDSYQEGTQLIQDYIKQKNALDVETEKYNNGLANDVQGQMQRTQEAYDTMIQGYKEGKIPFEIDEGGIQEAENKIREIDEEEIKAKLGVDTSEVQSEIDGTTAEAKVDAVVQLDQSSIDALVSGITGKPIELPVEPTISPTYTGSGDQPGGLFHGLIDEDGYGVNEAGMPAIGVIDTAGEHLANTLGIAKNQYDEMRNSANEVVASTQEAANTIDSGPSTVDTSSIENVVSELEGQEAEIPVSVKIDEGQFSTLYEGITGEPLPVEVQPEITGETPTPELPPTKQPIEYTEGEAPPEPNLDPAEREIEYTEGEAPPTPEIPPAEVKVNATEVPSVDVPEVSGTINYSVGTIEQPPMQVKTGVINYSAVVEEPPLQVKTGVINYTGEITPPDISDLSGTVRYTVIADPPPTYPTIVKSVHYNVIAGPVPSYPNLTRFVTYHVRQVGGAPAVNGTAHVSGTAFAKGTVTENDTKELARSLNPIPKLSARANAWGALEDDIAYAAGDWRTKRSATALVGELGPELVVTGNRWFTVGNQGAEFTNIPKGSIVFNHKQTEEIFKNGYVTSSGGRGKISGGRSAFASGTAYAEGTESKWKNTTDWIEKLLDFLENKVDRFMKRADFAINYKASQKALDKAGVYQEKQMNALTKAREKYIKQAQSVGLSDELRLKVQKGDYSITDYDESTQQKIKDYEEFQKKVRDCTDAMYELREAQQDLMQDKLDKVMEHYDARLGIAQGRQGIHEAYADYWEASGHGGNTQYKKQVEKQLQYQNMQSDILKEQMKSYRKEYFEMRKKLGPGNDKVREARANWLGIKEDYWASKADAESLKQEIRELGYTFKQNVADKFERAADKLSSLGDYIESKVNSTPEEQISNYESQIKNNSKLMVANKELADMYRARMVTLHANDEEYQELAQKVSELDNAIIDLAKTNNEIREKIRELRWQPFNDGITDLNNRLTEFDDIQGLLNQDGLINFDDGALTNQGYSNILLLSSAIDVNNAKIAEYSIGIQKLKEDLDNGNISQSKYNELLNEYQTEIRKAASSTKGYKQELIDMYNTQIKYELEALQENISARKDALKAKKDYYDYDRKIKKQTKDIDSIQAQIAALEGSTNAANKAKIAVLREQLAEAQDGLDSDIRDHAYDLQTDGYDKLSQNAEDALERTEQALQSSVEAQNQCVDNMLDHMTNSVKDAMGNVVSGFKIGFDSLQMVVDDFSLKLSEAFKQATQLGSQYGGNGQTITDNRPSNPSSGTGAAGGVDTSPIPNTSEEGQGALGDVTGRDPTKPVNKATGMTVAPSSVTLVVGQKITVTATVQPKNVDNSGCHWYISKEENAIAAKIVTVIDRHNDPSKGVNYLTIRGAQAGSATVKVYSLAMKDGGPVKKTLKIKVNGGTDDILGILEGQASTNSGSNAVNKVLREYGYGEAGENQMLAIAKDLGITGITEANLNDKGVQQQIAQDLRKRIHTERIYAIINSMPEEDRNKQDALDGSELNNFFSTHYKKKMLGRNAVEMANTLRLGFPDSYSEWTKSQRNELLGRLKELGFSQGGIVSKKRYIPIASMRDLLGEVPANNGDDGWITAKDGEHFLTADQSKELRSTMNSSIQLANQSRELIKNLRGIDSSKKFIVENNYDSMVQLNCNSITKDTFPGVKQMCKEAYQYTLSQQSKEFRKSGRK